MAHVVTDTGHDLGDVTDPGAVFYYSREPGYVIDGVPVVAPEAAPVVDETVTDDAPVPPAVSAVKAEWVDYALAVDPANAAQIHEMTKEDLVETYGGE